MWARGGDSWLYGSFSVGPIHQGGSNWPLGFDPTRDPTEKPPNPQPQPRSAMLPVLILVICLILTIANLRRHKENNPSEETPAPAAIEKVEDSPK
jgi:hypothetical protein